MFFLAIFVSLQLLISLIIFAVSLRLSSRILKVGPVTLGFTIAISLTLFVLIILLVFIKFVAPIHGGSVSNFYAIARLGCFILLILLFVVLKKKLNIGYLRAIGLFFVWLTLVALLSYPLGLAVKTYAYQAFRIPSGAMNPTILIGDHILAKKYAYWLNAPKRNDIIIFKYPKDPTKDFIKRVVGVGGDVVEIRSKQLYVNGKAGEAGYHADSEIYPKERLPRDNLDPVEVPGDALFVLGDNRDRSHDSRFWGFVPLESVKGKAYIIYWSQDRKTGRIRTDRIGTWLK